MSFTYFLPLERYPYVLWDLVRLLEFSHRLQKQYETLVIFLLFRTPKALEVLPIFMMQSWVFHCLEFPGKTNTCFHSVKWQKLELHLSRNQVSLAYATQVGVMSQNVFFQNDFALFIEWASRPDLRPSIQMDPPLPWRAARTDSESPDFDTTDGSRQRNSAFDKCLSRFRRGASTGKSYR